jgi:hypothetical protein
MMLLDLMATHLRLFDIWDVAFTGFGGAPVRAWYTRREASTTRCPPSWSTSATGAGAGSRTNGSPGPPPATHICSWTAVDRGTSTATAATPPTRTAVPPVGRAW